MGRRDEGVFPIAVLLWASLMLTVPFVSHASPYPAQNRVHAQIPMPWDQPPPEFKEMERQGFHAGVKAAINDYNHHREANPERRKEYRKPHAQRSFVEDYRKGFRRGYEDAMRHMARSSGRHS